MISTINSVQTAFKFLYGKKLSSKKALLLIREAHINKEVKR